MMDTVIYALAGLWSVGCIGLTVVGIWGLFASDEWGMGLVGVFLGFPIAVCLALAPWAMIQQAQSPDLATLKKNEWFCSASHEEYVTTYVQSGKVTVPVTTSHTVCDQYSRK